MEKINVEQVTEVLDFIEETISLYEMTPLFTEYNIPADRYFCCGGCGHFYTILKAEFPQAKCYVTPDFGHVLTEIDGVAYDVNGIYNEENFMYAGDLMEVPPSVEKIVTNYAFGLVARSWFGGNRPGPTNTCFIQVIAEMSEEERREAFDFFSYHNYTYFENSYKRYIEQDENLLEQFKNEAPGVVYPDFKNLSIIKCA